MITSMRLRFLYLLLCVVVAVSTVVLFSTIVFAQTETATLSGVVTDPQGAVVPGVEVVATRIETGTILTIQTNGAGIYFFTGLMPGHYHLVVRKQGFKEIAIKEIELHVQDKVERNFSLDIGSLFETITVEGGVPLVNTQDASVSTVIDRQFVENLPLNGRSFNTLLQLTPGVVIGQTRPYGLGQFSIAGQRMDANSFLVDGVSANFGVTPNTVIGESGTGGGQAFSALGGTSSLVSVDALQEFRIETSSFAPEFGRTPGGEIILTTRSGTNEFHGGVFDYFRNNVLDANDWFANRAGQPRAPERHNDFGGFLGGPIVRDKTFIFVSYEGARLRLPQTSVIQVPSLSARSAASLALAPLLNAYPIPNGPISANGYTAQFTGVYSNAATLDAGSIRIDHIINDRYSIFGRYNNAPSQNAVRSVSLNTIGTTSANTQTLTVGVNMLFSSRLSNTLRGNYSTQNSNLIYSLDSFGGAVALNPSLLIGALPSVDTYTYFQSRDTEQVILGPYGRNKTQQLNFVDDLSLTVGSHQLKFGGDYRDIFLDGNPPHYIALFNATTLQSFLSTGQTSLYASVTHPSQLLTQALSVFVQDTWKVTPRLALTYGLRWELSPAPAARGATVLASWTNTDNPSAIALAPQGTPLWSTTYRNFAPRIGVAFGLNQRGDFVLRAGAGLFYDTGVGSSATVSSQYPNFAAVSVPSVSVTAGNISPYLPALTLQPQPPYGQVYAFSPNLKLPRSYQWNVALEKSFGGRQVITATYVGQAGRDLIRQSALYQPNINFSSSFTLNQNDARSNYNALQLQYRRPLSARLQAILNYTWSHSLDNASNDLITGLSNTIISTANDYASSDFDVRHSFSGALTYDIPAVAKSGPLALLSRDWSLDTVIVARSGFPFNAVVLGVSPDPSGEAASRPDLVAGQPAWIPSSTAGGGKILNVAAFSVPSTIRQGTEGRNDIRGFGLTQIDLSAGRKFHITERLNLQFRADAFNVFNHPNFMNPGGYVQFGSYYIQSQSMLNKGLGQSGGLNSLFQEGGPRSVQLSLKLTF
jgi:hypothetical protein